MRNPRSTTARTARTTGTLATAAAMLAALAAASCGGGPVAYAPTPTWIADRTSLQPGSPTAPTVVQQYREVVARILASARADRGAYAKLSVLTDGIGARLGGSPQLDRAIAWAAAAMAADGQDVRTEPVMVPHWVRGIEEASIVSSALAPASPAGTSPAALRPLRVLGLGDTVSTPPGGVVAPVVVVTSWDDLQAQAAAVRGAIVLFDVPMPPWDAAKGFSGYGDVVPYRTAGPSRAAKLGAVGVLMRSVTAHSLGTLHTGALHYADDVAKLPAAAVTTEDADLLHRLAARGPVTVRLRLESQQLPDAPSANVIGELRGSEWPDQVVVLGAHIDSWDVGQGAHDDGAGCVIMMQALATLRHLGLHPRRTIRVVLFTNEENGTRGARAYAKDHAGELASTVMAIESDSGGFKPVGLAVDAPEDAPPEYAARISRRLAPIADLLAPVAKLAVAPGHSGTDVSPMIAGGVPALGLIVDSARYFDIHHTAADTLDKVSPQDLSESSAVIAVLAYIVADAPDRLDAL